jgi:transforming growth factor-beta-induced protein
MLSFILVSVLLAVSYGQTNNAGTLSNDGRLTKFIQLLDRAGISPSAGETIFAPTNEALNAFRDDDVGLWNKYASQAEFYVHLRDLLLWHFVTEGRFTFDQIFDGGRQFLENQQGNITISQQFKKIDNVPAAAFIEANISTSDGIVHVIDDVIMPPYLAMNIIEQLLDDRTAKFAFSTMANLALYVGLDEQINKMFEHGITLLVPPNRRFVRAQIDVPSLLTEEMRNYTRDFVKCHMIVDNYYEAGMFAYNSEMDQEQILVTSELGTSMWITTTDEIFRFQSTKVILADQPAKNG